MSTLTGVTKILRMIRDTMKTKKGKKVTTIPLNTFQKKLSKRAEGIKANFASSVKREGVPSGASTGRAIGLGVDGIKGDSSLGLHDLGRSLNKKELEKIRKKLKKNPDAFRK